MPTNMLLMTKGEFLFHLKEKSDHFELIIEDNGKGFDMGKNVQTLGLKIVRTLVYDQLGGEMRMQSREKTKYTIRFTRGGL